MSDQLAFNQLMERLKKGDQSAAKEIFDRYQKALIARAAHRLDARIRQKVDPEDVAQSALKSFFHRFAAGQYDITNWQSLWALLTRITLRKCGYQTRHYKTAQRNVHLETSTGDRDESVASHQAIARDPTPDEAAALTEAVDHVLGELDGKDRQIAELALSGCPIQEISVQVGVSERTVRRKMDRVENRLTELSSDPSESA